MTENNLDTLTPADYLRILRHRKYFVIVPAVLVFIVGVLVVMSLPPVYRSSATVLIESQQIPADFVRATITSFADERIEVIKQRVLTTENLLPIVEKFGLYAENRERLTPSELADLVRENFEIALVSANVGRSGRNQPLTIAFNIFFKDRSASASQKVVGELVTLFLSQDADIRTTKTRETQEFLEAQANKLGEAITAQEKRIADFKTAHRAQLPESASANQSLLDRLSGAHRDALGRMQALRNSIQVLEAQLSVSAANPGAGTPGVSSLAQMEQELARLLSQYTEKHPEVIALRERIAATRAAPADPSMGAANDPAFAQLRAQISSSRSELDFLGSEKTKLEAQLAEVEASINSAPEVERQYNELLRDMTNLTTEYQGVRSKALESGVAVQMESEQKGERFKLIEAPVVPTQPFSPDRPKLLIMVLFVSLGAGGAAMILVEMARPLLRGARSIAGVLGDQPLVTIPVIETAEDLRRGRLRNRRLLFGALALLPVVLLLTHYFIIELDLLWYQVLRRLGGL